MIFALGCAALDSIRKKKGNVGQLRSNNTYTCHTEDTRMSFQLQFAYPDASTAYIPLLLTDVPDEDHQLVLVPLGKLVHDQVQVQLSGQITDLGCEYFWQNF